MASGEGALRRLSFALLLAAACLQGCGTPPGDSAELPSTAPPPTGGERAEVLVHAWRALDRAPDEAWTGPRTALYTYVLVGDVGGADAASGSAAVANARRALELLLREVQAGQAAATIADAAVLRQANQFCLPARDYTGGLFTLKHYDFTLATTYVNQLRLALQPVPELAGRLAGVGPFLVGTRRPLGEIVARSPQGAPVIDTASPVLLVDLSGQHPKAMPAYVTAYKEAVRDIDAQRTAVLQPLRPAFASAVLKVNEALPFVAEAYAGTRKMFETAGGTP
ncbi:hypothetical protein [Methylibium sp.]|uniref:hypothetical protein n=1 Tax=Methylibium sp. TaxID=2067992 RepID=UPI003D0ED6EE